MWDAVLLCEKTVNVTVRRGWVVTELAVQLDEKQKREAGDEHAHSGGDPTDDFVGQG
jgi:hypothetical protein